MFPFFYDPTFILMIPAILLAIYAQGKVQRVFQKYDQYRARIGMTGAELARDILRRRRGYNEKMVSEIF